MPDPATDYVSQLDGLLSICVWCGLQAMGKPDEMMQLMREHQVVCPKSPLVHEVYLLRDFILKRGNRAELNYLREKAQENANQGMVPKRLKGF